MANRVRQVTRCNLRDGQTGSSRRHEHPCLYSGKRLAGINAGFFTVPPSNGSLSLPPSHSSITSLSLSPLFLHPSLSRFISRSLCLCFSHPLSLYLYIYLFFSLSPRLTLSLYLCHCMHFCLSLPLFLSLLPTFALSLLESPIWTHKHLRCLPKQ